MLAPMAGCWIPLAIGGMVESYKKDSTHSVEGEYTGLRGKTYAILVMTDRIILGNFPTIIGRFAAQATDRLTSENAKIGATGAVPAAWVMEFQLANPAWTSWTYDRIMDELGVERLVVIDITEYRLQEPGNSYLWDGVTSARVGVVEKEASIPGEFDFKKDVRVAFPNKKGIGPQDMSREVVQGQLDRRLLDRVTWLFYEHQEPYYPEY
ncbi:MAG TPA: hypothetical protein VG797_07505 [Phycisphaerales bacterium]|nr:hypothetical protein [Phycisphaerales bacterium]